MDSSVKELLPSPKPRPLWKTNWLRWQTTLEKPMRESVPRPCDFAHQGVCGGRAGSATCTSCPAFSRSAARRRAGENQDEPGKVEPVAANAGAVPEAGPPPTACAGGRRRFPRPAAGRSRKSEGARHNVQFFAREMAHRVSFDLAIVQMPQIVYRHCHCRHLCRPFFSAPERA